MSGDVTALGGAELSASDDSGDDIGVKFDFSSHVKDSEFKEEGPCFKPALRLFSHSYLGDMKDVPRCQISALSSGPCTLPFLYTAGPVYPGQVAPIQVPDHGMRLLEIVNSRSPRAGLIAVVGVPAIPLPRARSLNDGFRGCVAQVLQLTDDGKYGLVQGVGFWTGLTRRNLFEISSYLTEVDIEVWIETCPTIAESGSQLHELSGLAEKAQHNFRLNHPRVAGFEGDPLQVSYWLATHMPLPCVERQRLLDEPPHTRLESIIELSSEYKVLHCWRCGKQIADAKDLIQVVDQGPSLECIPLSPLQTFPAFVCSKNVTVDRIHTLPRIEASYWLPGYHQHKLHCSCRCAVGWVFTAWEANMPIPKFFALCHAAIKPKSDEALQQECRTM